MEVPTILEGMRRSSSFGLTGFDRRECCGAEWNEGFGGRCRLQGLGRDVAVREHWMRGMAVAGNRHGIAGVATNAFRNIAARSVEGDINPALYDKFVEFAVGEVGQHTHLATFPFEEEFKTMLALDGKTTVYSKAYQSEKIRLFRIATIESAGSIQVLNLTILPRPEFDLPFFCADFFSTSIKHIIVLDLNPLYDVERRKQYKEKYYPQLMPLVNKYIELLPWGAEITTESLQFLSPIVIWTKCHSRDDVQKTIYLAFTDYLKAWLRLMDMAKPATDPSEIIQNQDAQHRYLLWRATKDPGQSLLSRLLGDKLCEKYISEFLFNGKRSLGSKGFLDFFPEYRLADGSINRLRSIRGKSFPTRPWDKDGNFVSG